MKISVEMNFCRRCSSLLKNENNDIYKCANGHTIYLYSAPATGAILLNDKNEVLLLERAIDPGKGKLDIPGGFCDGAEKVEDALAREIQEETGLKPEQYYDLDFIVSGIDPYGYEGEVLPVLGMIFSAKLVPDVEPVAADDAASVKFVPLAKVNMDKIYFPSVRAALEKLRRQA